MARTTPDPVYTFRKSMGPINCFLFYIFDNDELLFVGTAQGIVHTWDLKTRRELKSTKVGDQSCLAIIRFDERVVTQERGASLKFWRVQDLEWHFIEAVEIDYHGFCSILLWEDKIYFPQTDGVISVYGKNSKKITCVNKEKGEVMCMKCMVQQNCLLVAYEGGMLSLWTIIDNSTNIVHEILYTDTPMCLDFCELTSEGILGTSGDSLKKFSIENNKINKIGSTSLTNPGVACATINSDGKLLVVGCWDGRIRYFSMKHLKLLAVLDHHTEGAVQCVMFLKEVLLSSPVGILFAGGCDGKISMWDLYTQKTITN